MSHELTIIFVLLATQFVLYAGGWWLYAALAPADRGAAVHWGLFNVLLGAGMLLAWTRDETRGWAAYVGSSLCFVSAFVAGWRGSVAFMRSPQQHRLQLLLMGLVVGTLLAAGPGLERAPLRVFATYSGCALFIGLAIRQTRQQVRAEFRGRLRLALRVSTGLAMVVLGARGLQQLISSGGSMELQPQVGADLGLMFSYLVMVAVFNFACLGLHLLRYVRQLRELTQRDPLTGLLNRRAFDEETQREWKRRCRLNTPLALAAFDLDHFKAVNDQHGHGSGDLVLQHSARVLRETARETDIVARLGGEEFVIVMPLTTLEQALVATERLRQRLEAGSVLSEAGVALRITASIGLAQALPADADVQALLKRADEALYRAKREGRNRVCQAEPAAPAGEVPVAS